jgi:hypothetical protein
MLTCFYTTHISYSLSEFGTHVEKCVLDLQDLFRDGLEDKCQVGAANVSINISL